MSDKIALVSCSGLSPLGLVVRAASVELALENENIVAACITEYSAQPNSQTIALLFWMMRRSSQLQAAAMTVQELS